MSLTFNTGITREIIKTRHVAHHYFLSPNHSISLKSVTDKVASILPFSRFSPTIRTDSDRLHNTGPTYYYSLNINMGYPHIYTETITLNRQNVMSTTTASQRFPLSNFKYFFTLFSKFFSSFHHCTCSLSVSRLYLALDETYHPFRAAIPNNSTL